MSTLNEADVRDLDPGIRDLVVKLNALGFTTTDSGDGVSKPSDWFESGDALSFAHVACVVNRLTLFTEADRLQDVLGDDWSVEASYSPRDGVAILFACKCEDRP